MIYSLGISNFLEEISSLSHSIVFLYFFALITEEGFLAISLLAILWHSAFKWVYLSFSPLLLASLLFTAICKASPDSVIITSLLLENPKCRDNFTNASFCPLCPAWALACGLSNCPASEWMMSGQPVIPPLQSSLWSLYHPEERGNIYPSGPPGFDPWVGKIPWRRERLPTPVFWPREFHGLYSPWGCKELNTNE